MRTSAILPKQLILFLAVVTNVPTLVAGSLIITGIVDGPLQGGLPKTIELYATHDIPDLSVYSLEVASNGDDADGPNLDLGSVSVPAGTFLYVSKEIPSFRTFFELTETPRFFFTRVDFNGDDAALLYKNLIPIDVFGEVGVDGDGTDWLYRDGWGYRNGGTGPDGARFPLSSWTFSGARALDEAKTNAGAKNPFPIGSYTSSSVIITGVIDGPLDGGLPKAVELYTLDDVDDLSVYGLESANNNNDAKGRQFTFPSRSLGTGEYMYVVRGAGDPFEAFFGTTVANQYPHSGGATSFNGNDAIILYKRNGLGDDVQVDVFGTVGQNEPNPLPWNYGDGWAYRNDSTGPDGSSFQLSSWSFGRLDGKTMNTDPNKFPLGTYKILKPPLVITGVMDGPTGADRGQPKGIELFVRCDIPDLSIFGIESANNGVAATGEEFTFAGSAAAGDYIYVVTQEAEFRAHYTPADATIVTSSVADIDGDDAIVLYMNGVAIDIFGVVGKKRSNMIDWDHKDGYVNRKNGKGPSTSFDLSEWIRIPPTEEYTFPIETYQAFPKLSLSGDGAASEGSMMAFKVILSFAVDYEVGVDFQIIEGTASASDYTFPGPLALIFAPGDTEQTVNVQIVDDDLFEADEVFTAWLDNPSVEKIAIERSQVKGTIVDNEQEPTLSLAGVSRKEGDSGTSAFIFDLSLSYPSYEDISIIYNTQDDTATSGTDFSAVSGGTITFVAGEIKKTISIDVIGDTEVEADEEFLLILAVDQGMVVLPMTPATGTILDDDNPCPAEDFCDPLDPTSRAVCNLSKEKKGGKKGKKGKSRCVEGASLSQHMTMGNTCGCCEFEKKLPLFCFSDDELTGCPNVEDQCDDDSAADKYRWVCALGKKGSFENECLSMSEIQDDVVDGSNLSCGRCEEE